MKFVWDMKESTWEEFADAIDRGALDVAYIVGEYLGCCRVGDLCFDICAWNGGEWTGWGFNLYCGGVDSSYGYSTREAMATGKYKNGYEVPKEAIYPYDEVDYGEFPIEYTTYSLKEFQDKAEVIFEEFIKKSNYDKADLVAKANEPLRTW